MTKKLILFIIAFVAMFAFAIAVSFAIDCPEGKTPVTIFKGGTGQFLQVCVSDKAVDKIGGPNDFVVAGECPCSPGFQVPDPYDDCVPHLVINDNEEVGEDPVYAIIDRVDFYFDGCAPYLYLSVGHDHIFTPYLDKNHRYYDYEDGNGTEAYGISVEEAKVCAEQVKAFAFALDADCSTNIPNVDCAEALPDFLYSPPE